MNARRIPLSLIVGALLVGVLVLIALVSLVWLPYPIEDTSGGRLEGFSADHLLGTDRLGHDLASRMMVGARIALIVGLGAVAVAALIGVSVGLAIALARPWVVPSSPRPACPTWVWVHPRRTPPGAASYKTRRPPSRRSRWAPSPRASRSSPSSWEPTSRPTACVPSSIPPREVRSEPVHH